MTGASDVISLPNGGGALAGIGEKFAPDLHTGTGNFTVPLAVPPGRNGLQPKLDLVYSTGAGNGPFGLGWSLSLPGVSRRTAKGVPRYDEDRDVYVLSGAEDLEPVEWDGAVTRYRPRTEGLFARILRHRGPGDSHWEVRSKDGLVTTYGTPGVFPDDPATVADPADRKRVYAWNITSTADPHGNHVAYEYHRDTGGRVDDPNRRDVDDPHHWDQVYVACIRYADHGPDRANPPYLVSVTFEYEERPDSFSERRSGFEVRTRLRCARIVVGSHTDADHIGRTYELDYADQLGDDSRPQPPNGVSLLARLRVTGHDEDRDRVDAAVGISLLGLSAGEPEVHRRAGGRTAGPVAYRPGSRACRPVGERAARCGAAERHGAALAQPRRRPVRHATPAALAAGRHTAGRPGGAGSSTPTATAAPISW